MTLHPRARALLASPRGPLADELALLCERFGVRSLDLFGSAARGEDFDPARSDLDILVTYEPARGTPSLADFLDLRDALSSLLGRKVDLAMDSAIRNPFIRAAIEADRIPLHAA